MSFEFSDRGIPILDTASKVEALQYCLQQGANEDAMGHLFDLMAKIQPTLPVEVGGQKPWGREAIIEVFTTYGSSPTMVRDASQGPEL